MAVTTMNHLWGLRSTAQNVAILVRVYNKPDSAITRIGIANRQRRREKLFLQICSIIAASKFLRISIGTQHNL